MLIVVLSQTGLGIGLFQFVQVWEPQNDLRLTDKAKLVKTKPNHCRSLVILQQY